MKNSTMNRMLLIMFAVGSWQSLYPQAAPLAPLVSEKELLQLVEQKRQEVIEYAAKLVPITKETVLFAHTNADAIARELEYSLAASERTQDAETAIARKMIQLIESLAENFINKSASITLDAWIKQESTQQLMAQLSAQWKELGELKKASCPADTCPILRSVNQTVLQAVQTATSDAWSWINKNTTWLQQPQQKLSDAQKKALLESLHEGIILVQQNLELSISLQKNNPQFTAAYKTMLAKAIAVLKDTTIIDTLCKHIDESKQTIDTLKFFEAALATMIEPTVNSRLSVQEFFQAAQEYNELMEKLMPMPLQTQTPSYPKKSKNNDLHLGNMSVPVTLPSTR